MQYSWFNRIVWCASETTLWDFREDCLTVVLATTLYVSFRAEKSVFAVDILCLFFLNMLDSVETFSMIVVLQYVLLN